MSAGVQWRAPEAGEPNTCVPALHVRWAELDPSARRNPVGHVIVAERVLAPGVDPGVSYETVAPAAWMAGQPEFCAGAHVTAGAPQRPVPPKDDSQCCWPMGEPPVTVYPGSQVTTA